jgi:hypothetical protein
LIPLSGITPLVTLFYAQGGAFLTFPLRKSRRTTGLAQAVPISIKCLFFLDDFLVELKQALDTVATMQLDYSTKTRRQLWAILDNNAPGSTAWYLHHERAKAAHRAAWAKITKRQANR